MVSRSIGGGRAPEAEGMLSRALGPVETLRYATPRMATTRVQTNTARILDRALGMLGDAPPDGHLIDLPCGTGYLSTRAAEQGWRVTPCDLGPTLWQGDPATHVVAADMNGALPLPDATADAVACCEGLEHIENPWHVLREFRRVLRPGGQLVISLPNTVDLRQRFRMLRRGYWGHYFPRVPDHINHMGVFALCHALLRTGFTIEDIRSAKVYGGAGYRLLTPLFRFRPQCGLPPKVCRLLSRHEVLCGRTAIVRAAVARS